jgi:hypothetical protein
MTDEEKFFCERCGKQLTTIDEIETGLCNFCIAEKEEGQQTRTFQCEICGKQLKDMNEIAQGICHNCKASIIRKIENE